MPQREGLFRKTAIDNMRAPEQLNDYIKVTTPGAWAALAAVLVLLGGLLVWGFLGGVEIARVVDGQRVTDWVRPISFLFG
jgi:hypothetical protein